MSVGDPVGGPASNGGRPGRSHRARAQSLGGRRGHPSRPHPAQTLFVPRSSFVGRDDAKEEVLWRLRMSGLLTLTGPGGVGKTRLALEVASELAEQGEAVACVDLAAVYDAGSVLPAVAEATGLGADPGRSLADTVVTHLGGEPLVLVLDNCEHLRPACAEVAERLLSRCRGLRILATSRERLGAVGEVVWPVPPLSLPTGEGTALPDAFVASEAVQLFCDRAASLHRGFLPVPDNVGAIVEICRRLDANPLAIELAAAHVVALPPAEIAARLDDRFALLTGGPTTAPERHQSLRATLDWSYNLLTDPERDLLQRLSVFAGSFSLRAAEQVCGEGEVEPAHVLELLTRLVDKSLVVAEPTGRAGRFRLPETVRVYAGERLAEEGDAAALAERHVAWCLAQLEEADGDGEWVERLDADRDSLRTAREWALAQGRAELALRLVTAQMPLWARRGRFAEAQEAAERVLAATHGERQPLRAAVLVDSGSAALSRGDLDAAHRHLLAAVALSADGPHAKAAVRAQTLLAFTATFDDDPARVDDLEHHAAEIAAAGDDACRAEALVACGQARMCRGEPAAARRHFREAVATARRSGERSLLAAALAGLGSAELVRGDYAPAEGHLTDGAELAAALGDAYGLAMAGTWLGELALVQGDGEEAGRRFEECLGTTRAMGAPHPLARSLLGLGLTALEAGERHEAGAAFDEAANLARAAGLAHLAVRALVGSGKAALALGDTAGARADLDEALSLARRRADRAGEALGLEGCAELSRADGDVKAAANRYRQAIARHAQVGDPAAVARCLEVLGRLAADDELAPAARLLGAARSLRARRGCARPAAHDEQHAALVESLRRGLGESFVREWCRGEAMSTEVAVAYAERWRGPKRRRPEEGWEALTGAERRVAELAAQGHTNAEIAKSLGIARSTVKAHLRQVFAKLGVHSRAALAAKLSRRGG